MPPIPKALFKIICSLKEKILTCSGGKVYAVLAGTATTTASSAQWSGRIPRRTRGGCGGADGGGAVRADKIWDGGELDGKLYVLSWEAVTCNDNDGTLSSMERHDPAGWIRHAWEDVAPMAAARAKPRTAAAALDQRSMAVCTRCGQRRPRDECVMCGRRLRRCHRTIVLL